MSVLESLGFAPFFSDQLRPGERETLVPGRAVADRGRRLLVRFEDGERLVAIPGRLRAAGVAPVVGDFILAAPGDAPTLVRVLERRSRLSRNAAGRPTTEQVLAANVDVVLVVNGLDAGVNPRRLERTLAAVHAGGAVPAVLLTKSDLAADPAEALADAAAAAPGIPVHAVSCVTGEGVDAVRALLAPGRTGVFTGPSGAGKSTLVNALVGAELQPTAPVREHDRRGRHTTTGRLLVQIPGRGAVIDGPGIRELQLWDAGGIEAAFEDVAAVGQGCRFGDCSHAGEPGCAVEAAIEAGTLDPERLLALQKLQGEAAAHEARQGGPAGRAKREQERAVHRELRRFQRRRGRE